MEMTLDVARGRCRVRSWNADEKPIGHGRCARQQLKATVGYRLAIYAKVQDAPAIWYQRINARAEYLFVVVVRLLEMMGGKQHPLIPDDFAITAHSFSGRSQLENLIEMALPCLVRSQVSSLPERFKDSLNRVWPKWAFRSMYWAGSTQPLIYQDARPRHQPWQHYAVNLTRSQLRLKSTEALVGILNTEDSLPIPRCLSTRGKQGCGVRKLRLRKRVVQPPIRILSGAVPGYPLLENSRQTGKCSGQCRSAYKGTIRCASRPNLERGVAWLQAADETASRFGLKL